MNVCRRAILQAMCKRALPFDPRRFLQENNNRRSWSGKARNGYQVATFDLIDRNIRQIESRAHSRLRDFYFVTVTLNGTNARFQVGRVNNDLLSAAQQSPG